MSDLPIPGPPHIMVLSPVRMLSLISDLRSFGLMLFINPPIDLSKPIFQQAQHWLFLKAMHSL